VVSALHAFVEQLASPWTSSESDLAQSATSFQGLGGESER